MNARDVASKLLKQFVDPKERTALHIRKATAHPLPVPSELPECEFTIIYFDDHYVIASKDRWEHEAWVKQNYPDAGKRFYGKPKYESKRKIYPTVAQVAEMLNSGRTQRSIAKQYECSEAAIYYKKLQAKRQNLLDTV